MVLTVPGTTTGTTRKDLRRMLLRMVGDLVVATATATGTTTTFIAAVTLTGEPGRYAGRWVRFTAGTAGNLGAIRWIEGSDRTGTLTFRDALPVATATGDELEMTNAFGMGITFDEVDAAINHAIALGRPHALIPARYEPAALFDKAAPTVDLHADLVAVESVRWQHPTTGTWYPIRPAAAMGRLGWWLDRAAEQLVISGREADAADGAQLSISGYVRPAELVADTDRTLLPVEWLLNRAAAHLLLDVVHAPSREWANQGLLYLQEAERLRPMLTPRLSASMKRVR